MFHVTLINVTSAGKGSVALIDIGNGEESPINKASVKNEPQVGLGTTSNHVKRKLNSYKESWDQSRPVTSDGLRKAKMQCRGSDVTWSFLT